MSEYDRELIHNGPRRKAQEKLEACLMEGIQSGEPSEFTHKDWEDIRREALRELEARKGKKKF